MRLIMQLMTQFVENSVYIALLNVQILWSLDKGNLRNSTQPLYCSFTVMRRWKIRTPDSWQSWRLKHCHFRQTLTQPLRPCLENLNMYKPTMSVASVNMKVTKKCIFVQQCFVGQRIEAIMRLKMLWKLKKTPSLYFLRTSIHWFPW